MANARQIAEALHGLTTGDQIPPRPWAHMSHVGEVGTVTDVALTRIHSAGGTTVGFWTYSMTVDGQGFRVLVQKLETP